MVFHKITKVKQLRLKANTLRQHIITMLRDAKSGHPGGALGMADVFSVLYFNILCHKPTHPHWNGRDRVVVSNGHICPVLYAALCECGYFPKKELGSLRQINSLLQGHPHHDSLPGIETSTGPLGQGIAVSVGMSLAHLMDKGASRVYCFMGDGELNEGACWEAFLVAGARRLRNLCVIVDRNNIQIDGNTEDVLALDPLVEKFKSFHFHVIEVNGHSHSALIEAFEEAKSIYEKPTVIIAHTIPGKGVDFMENDYRWHGKAPTAEQAKIALHELTHERAEIMKEK